LPWAKSATTREPAEAGAKTAPRGNCTYSIPSYIVVIIGTTAASREPPGRLYYRMLNQRVATLQTGLLASQVCNPLHSVGLGVAYCSMRSPALLTPCACDSTNENH